MKCHFTFSRLATVFHLLVLLAAQYVETLTVVVAITDTAYIVYLFFRDCEKEAVLYIHKEHRIVQLLPCSFIIICVQCYFKCIFGALITACENCT